MNRKNIILLAIAFVSFTPVSGKNWLGKLFKGAAEAFGGHAVEQIAKRGGYSDEDARKFREDIYNSIGASNANAELGIKYATANNSFEKKNAIKDILWNNSGIDSGKYGEVLSVVKQISDTQTKFISDKANVVSEQDVANALIKRDSTLLMIGYDMYQAAKEKQAVYLSEKLQMEKLLISKGIDPGLAKEAAGTLISVRKNPQIPEEEKEKYYEAFGLSESKEEVWGKIDEVCSPGYVHNSIVKDEEQAETIIEEEPLVFHPADNFEFNKATLSDENQSRLDTIAAKLIERQDLKIVIVGHTCNIGSDEANWELGLKRANSAKDYLVLKGVLPDRIVTDSKGANKPLNSNSTKSERSVNRRVEITLQ